MINLAAVYQRFFDLGGPPAHDRARPWHYRRQCTSLRLPGVELLGMLVRERQPARVLDLGSGLTTVVLRNLQAEFPAMQVTTTDTNPRWLKTTAVELLRDGLNADAMFEHDVFMASDNAYRQFDLISLDIGNSVFRARLAPDLLRWLAPGGIILIDDWDLPAIQGELATALRAGGMIVTHQKSTLDEFGSSVALARWK